MPIQLQNHRLSNAKLTSATGQKQKLMTAASFQKQQNAKLKVARSGSGKGNALLNRIMDSKELRGHTKNPNRRRMSIGGSSPQTELGCASPKLSPRISSSKKTNKQPTCILDENALVPPAMKRSISQNGKSSSDKRKSVRRSRSFGLENIKSTFLWRNSGDNRATTNRATSPPRKSDSAIPKGSLSSAPRQALSSKREQMRRNTMSNMPSSLLTTPPPPPPPQEDNDDLGYDIEKNCNTPEEDGSDYSCGDDSESLLGSETS